MDAAARGRRAEFYSFLDNWDERNYCDGQGLYVILHETSFGFIGGVHCARTDTRIRRHSNQEKKKQNPNPRRPKHLFMYSVQYSSRFERFEKKIDQKFGLRVVLVAW